MAVTISNIPILLFTNFVCIMILFCRLKKIVAKQYNSFKIKHSLILYKYSGRNMYVPEHFKENRPEEITRIIENFPLAMLVVNSKNGFIANHLPLLVNKSSKKEIELIGHIAKANSLYKEIDNNDDVLVIFRSEDAYISPNWYPSRKNREHVPTWNYQAVHLHGNIIFTKEKKFLLKTVEQLTKVYEQKNHKEYDWNINSVASKFMSSMLNEIIGIKIVVSKQIAKSKLSQNREKEDINNVYKELKSKGFEFLANSMKKL